MERLTSVSFPDYTSSIYNWTNLDLGGVKDRSGHWANAQIDNMRRLTSFTDRNGNVTRYGYCPCVALTSIIDPLNNSTTLNRDYISRITSILFSDAQGHGITRTLGLDSVGQVTNQTDNVGGINLNYTYDWLGRLTNVSSAGNTLYAATCDPYYTYYNLLLTIQNADGLTVQYTYDYWGRIYREDLPSNSVQYNYAGPLLTRLYNGSEWIQYGYDPAGRLVSTLDADGNTNAFEHDAIHDVDSGANPAGGVSGTRGQDDDGAVGSAAGAVHAAL